jgi:hypothetical protein
MAHFAQLDDENIVVRVIVISNDDILDEDGNESEEIGIALCKRLTGEEDSRWIQTSINSNIRRQYASVGGIYDPINDVFIDPKPIGVDSFILVDGKWTPPIPRPEQYTQETWPLTDRPFTEHHTFLWNEENVSWDLFAPREQPEPE